MVFEKKFVYPHPAPIVQISSDLYHSRQDAEIAGRTIKLMLGTCGDNAMATVNYPFMVIKKFEFSLQLF